MKIREGRSRGNENRGQGERESECARKLRRSSKSRVKNLEKTRAK